MAFSPSGASIKFFVLVQTFEFDQEQESEDQIIPSSLPQKYFEIDNPFINGEFLAKLRMPSRVRMRTMGMSSFSTTRRPSSSIARLMLSAIIKVQC